MLSNCRLGVASLELLLVLVPVLFFVAMLLWMYSIGINQSFVTVEARYEAWSKRDSEKANPFEMSDYAQGLIKSSKQRQINVSPTINNSIVPKSSHQLYAGTWNFPHVDLNRTPNLNLQKRLVQKGVQTRVGTISNAVQSLGDIDGQLSKFENLDVQQEGLRELGRIGLERLLMQLLPFAGMSEAAAMGNKLRPTDESAKALAEAKAKLQESIATLREEIRRDREEFQKEKNPIKKIRLGRKLGYKEQALNGLENIQIE